MSLSSQRLIAHTRWLTPAALVLLASLWGAGAARADIYVHILSCTIQPFVAEAFDAKDTVKAVPASTTKFHGDVGQTGSLHCAGEGKGYCQMTLTVGDTDGGGTIGFKLDSGKWAVATFNISENKFSVQKNLDSQPSCN